MNAFSLFRSVLLLMCASHYLVLAAPAENPPAGQETMPIDGKKPPTVGPEVTPQQTPQKSDTPMTMDGNKPPVQGPGPEVSKTKPNKSDPEDAPAVSMTSPSTVSHMKHDKFADMPDCFMTTRRFTRDGKDNNVYDHEGNLVYTYSNRVNDQTKKEEYVVKDTKGKELLTIIRVRILFLFSLRVFFFPGENIPCDLEGTNLTLG